MWRWSIIMAVKAAIGPLMRQSNMAAARPPSANAHGIANTEVPIMVFQMLHLEMFTCK